MEIFYRGIAHESGTFSSGTFHRGDAPISVVSGLQPDTDCRDHHHWQPEGLTQQNWGHRPQE